MERLLWTPDQIAEQQIIPYCAEEIRRLVRKGEIPAVRRQGRRILIHHKDLEVYADKFRSGHTDAQAGPHASEGEKDVCRERRKKVSTKERTRRTGGQASSMDADSELGALLGYQ